MTSDDDLAPSIHCAGLVMRVSRPPGLPTLPPPPITRSPRPSSAPPEVVLTVPASLPLPSASQGEGPLDCPGFRALGDPPRRSSLPRILAQLNRMGDHHPPGPATRLPEWEGLMEKAVEQEGLTEKEMEWEGLTEIARGLTEKEHLVYL